METLIYLFKSAGLLSLFFLGYEFLLKKETFFQANRSFLAAGIAIAFLLPTLVFENVIWTNPVSAAVLNEIPIAAQAILPNGFWASLELTDFLLLGYGLITFLFLSRFIVQLGSLYILLKKNKITHRKNGICYHHVPDELGPFSFFNSVVINPQLYSATQLDMILKHEEVHVKQKHSLDLLLANLTCVFLWFNPLSWLYKKRINQNLEFLADQQTTANFDSLKNYQRCLVNASVKMPIAFPVTNFHQSFIKKRILMLHKNQSNRHSFLKTLLILPFLAFFVWGFQVQTVEKEKRVRTSEKIQGKIESPLHALEASFNESELKDLSDLLNRELKSTQVRFSKVKRNTEKLITYISVDTKKKEEDHFGNRFIVKGKKPISTVYFKTDGDELSIFQDEVITKIDNNGNASATVDTTKYEVQIISSGKEPKNPKPNTFYVYQDQNKQSQDTEPLYVVNGEIISKKEADAIDPDQIENIDVLKDKENVAVYGEKGKNGVVIITTKRIASQRKYLVEYIKKNTLFFIDGKESTKETVEAFDPSEIKNVNVLKGKNAQKKYDDRAEDGVIEVSTKKKK